ncbi:hypothetical protein ACSMXN_00470 [Jatrophihabitans sp. DSM 45814]
MTPALQVKRFMAALRMSARLVAAALEGHVCRLLGGDTVDSDRIYGLRLRVHAGGLA